MHLAFLAAWLASLESIKDAAVKTAKGLLGWYTGNEPGGIPGTFPEKWWEGSALFISLIVYWFYTGDDHYNNLITKDMQHQAGDCNYMPDNFSTYLGNNDQFFWGTPAMLAAKYKFPEADDGYLYGYNLKNSISNGGFFQLAACLSLYTKNNIYATWAEKTWDRSVLSPLINNKTWNMADSVTTEDKYSTQVDNQWSYNYSVYLTGAAYMYNYIIWKTAVNSLLDKLLQQFFPEDMGGEDIFTEFLCKPKALCNFNKILFKGIILYWLTLVALIVPETYNRIYPKLQTSAQAAAMACSGDNNNTLWHQMQIIATNILSSALLSEKRAPPLNTNTGGNSKSDPNAGMGIQINPSSASILTVLFVAAWGGMTA
ncbi:glycoside hydrolase [Aspergillus aurantiobrunneus]